MKLLLFPSGKISPSNSFWDNLQIFTFRIFSLAIIPVVIIIFLVVFHYRISFFLLIGILAYLIYKTSLSISKVELDLTSKSNVQSIKELKELIDYKNAQPIKEYKYLTNYKNVQPIKEHEELTDYMKQEMGKHLFYFCNNNLGDYLLMSKRYYNLNFSTSQEILNKSIYSRRKEWIELDADRFSANLALPYLLIESAFRDRFIDQNFNAIKRNKDKYYTYVTVPYLNIAPNNKSDLIIGRFNSYEYYLNQMLLSLKYFRKQLLEHKQSRHDLENIAFLIDELILKLEHKKAPWSF